MPRWPKLSRYSVRDARDEHITTACRNPTIHSPAPHIEPVSPTRLSTVPICALPRSLTSQHGTSPPAAQQLHELILTPRQLPLGLLTAATGHPMLVELKSGETLNGLLVNCDTWMNLTLREVVQTSADGDKFMRLPEIYVRGSTVRTTTFIYEVSR